MSGIIRPELWDAAKRARELLLGLGIALLGVLWALNTFALGRMPGLFLAVLGCFIAIIGAQRLRFRVRGDGPGVVQVTEAQVAYFGPLDGGVVALDQLQSITLDPTGLPLHWHLRHDGGPDLTIPVTAKGADALFDAFAQLPAMQTEALLRALHVPGSEPQLVWQRGGSPSGRTLRSITSD